MSQQSILKKIRKIESLISELKQEVKKENSIPIIKAGIGYKKVIAELSMPGQLPRPVMYEITADPDLDLENLCRAIYQSIGAIPITVVDNSGFDLYVSHMTPLHSTQEEPPEVAYSDRTMSLVKKMKEIIEGYGVKVQQLNFEELKEIEEEYDTLHNS